VDNGRGCPPGHYGPTMNVFLGLVVIALGAWQVAFPESPLFMGGRWRWEDGEPPTPSRAYRGLLRATGVVGVAAGLVLLGLPLATSTG